MKKDAVIKLLLVSFILSTLVIGCDDVSIDTMHNLPEEQPEIIQEELSKSTDELINEWMLYSEELFLGQSRELDGNQYLLVTYGKKYTDGYGVEIKDVEVQEDHVLVTVHFSKNSDVNSQQGYAYDLVTIPASGLPVVFEASGIEEMVPKLENVDYLHEIVASSPSIKLFSPEPNSIMDRQFRIEGIVRIKEGNLLYRVTDTNGVVLLYGSISPSAYNWRYFSLNVDLDQAMTLNIPLVVELFTATAGLEEDGIKLNIALPGYEEAIEGEPEK